jgi:hypothetical protein
VTRNNKRPPTKKYPEFTLFYSYVSATNKVDDTEPCMCLGRAGIKRSAWVIPLSAAHMYADSQTGEPTKYLIGKSVEIASHLGLGITKDTCFKIMSVIVDNLSDLIRMPPWAGFDMDQIVREAERQQLKVTLNGEELLDTTR